MITADAITYVGGFCARNASTCDKAAEGWEVFTKKADTAWTLGKDMAWNYMVGAPLVVSRTERQSNQGPAPMRSEPGRLTNSALEWISREPVGSGAGGSDRRGVHSVYGTLTPSDREPEWRGPCGPQGG